MSRIDSRVNSTPVRVNAKDKVIVNDWDYVGPVVRDLGSQRHGFRTVSVTDFVLKDSVLTGFSGNMAVHVNRYARGSLQSS